MSDKSKSADKEKEAEVEIDNSKPLAEDKDMDEKIDISDLTEEENKDEDNSSNDVDESKIDSVHDKFEEELKALKAENETLKQQLLQLAAEYDNFRKRSKRERESAYSDSRAQTLLKLFPVLDNFERATANDSTDVKDYKKGVEMTYVQLIEILAKLGVEAFGEIGEAFDPNIHNAVMHIEDEELGDNVIAEVFQNGYKIGDKVIRHAVVKVAN